MVDNRGTFLTTLNPDINRCQLDFPEIQEETEVAGTLRRAVAVH
jgi:hypothetical protein